MADTRVRFLTHDLTDAPTATSPSTTVRSPILASWRRSQDLHVAADRIEMPFVRDVDHDTPLTRSAGPVLRNLREQLEGQSVSVILTDPAGLVLSRLTGDGDLERHLDHVLLAPGFSYAEKFVGTNGIGTALEVGGPAHVFGHEHYAENLEDLACAGVPIHHPVSGPDGRRRRPHLLAQGRRRAAADAGQDHRRADPPGAAHRRPVPSSSRCCGSTSAPAAATTARCSRSGTTS